MVEQCDCMSMHGFQWHWVTGVYWWRDRSTRKNSEVYRDILSAQIQSNAAKLIGWRFIVQMDDDSKHTAKATQEFLKVINLNILQWPSQSSDLNPIEHAFHLLKTKLKAERPKTNNVKGYSTPNEHFVINHLPPCRSKPIKALFIFRTQFKIFWIKTGRLVTVPLTAKQLTLSRLRKVRKTSSK